ncbi:C-reactive protein-like [Leptodactylus fuscus]|uniref:C-reactive protein-like n=1 Tax=Leptodactylus fuscus TaxID=238119 RepID=UPI003F4F15BD
MVLSVAVTNRQDGSWERLSNAEIRIEELQRLDTEPQVKGKEILEVTRGNIPSVIEGEGLDGSALIFPEEGNQTFAILQPREPIDLTEFTLCFRVATALSGHREVILFSYCNNGADELNVWREFDGRLSLYLRTSSEPTIFSLPALSTFGTHVCVTWESSSGVTSFWVDGKRSARQVYRKGHHVSPGGIVILGQDQDTCGGRFDAKQSLVGEISDVHLWNYLLPSSTIKDVHEKRQSAGGNIIDWSSVHYRLYGNAVIQSVDV